jgi:transposase
VSGSVAAAANEIGDDFVRPICKKTPTICASRHGYDTDVIIGHSEAKGAAVIPPKLNRKQQREYDRNLYKQRNRIERCFSRLKHFRRFTTRYEKKTKLLCPSSPSPALGSALGNK